MAVLDQAMQMGQLSQADRAQGQASFFPIFDEGEKFKTSSGLPELAEWPENTLLAYEKETLGFYVTGHPLARYEELLRTYASTSSARLASCKDGEEVNLGGIITTIKRIITRKGERMAFLSLEDLEGFGEVVIFPSLFEKVKDRLKVDNLIFVKGRIDLRGEKPKIIGGDLFPLNEVRERMTREIHITIHLPGLEDDILMRLKKILLSSQGTCQVYCHFIDGNKKEAVLMAGKDIRPAPTAEMIRQIESLLGEKSVAFSS
jgi:DNA polymerase-3 subunit alpha